jgi:oligopeptide/dipeptide ABC transporter ATP-binding protein
MVQAQIIDLINSLRKKLNMSMIIITHDLSIITEVCDRVAVMYAGKIVEMGKTDEVVKNPKHPYTKGLLAAIPKLDAPRDVRLADIPGTVPPPDKWPKGCAFAPRCPIATEECKEKPPPLKKDSSHLWCCCK